VLHLQIYNFQSIIVSTGPWSRVRDSDKLIVARLTKISPLLRTRTFITAFTRARHWTLSSSSYIQYILNYTKCNNTFLAWLPSSLLLSDLTTIICMCISCHHACHEPRQFFLLRLIPRITFSKHYKCSSSLRNVLHPLYEVQIFSANTLFQASSMYLLLPFFLKLNFFGH
jgi:hypothetical protein